MPASPQMKHRILQVHLRAMNARLRKIDVAPLSSCGGDIGEPYIIDVGKSHTSGTQRFAEIDVRFPTCPTDNLWDPDFDRSTAPTWRINLVLTDEGRPSRSLGTINIETDHALFSGTIFHGLRGAMHWHIAWAMEFNDPTADPADPASKTGSSGWRDPGKGGLRYL